MRVEESKLFIIFYETFMERSSSLGMLPSDELAMAYYWIIPLIMQKIRELLEILNLC